MIIKELELQLQAKEIAQLHRMKYIGTVLLG